MKFIIILFFSIIYNFLYSITPEEILASTEPVGAKFHTTKLHTYKDFDKFYKQVELPFYFKYEGKGVVIWLQIIKVMEDKSFLFGDALAMRSQAWSNQNNEWFNTYYFGGCKDTDLKNRRIWFFYLKEPLIMSKHSTDTDIYYEGTRLDTSLDNITFYFEYKKPSHTSEVSVKHSVSDEEESDDEATGLLKDHK